MKAIEHNVRVHDSISDLYEQVHGEIFNPIEQDRLYQELKQSLVYIETSSGIKEAFDYGCGSGNLTKHLLNLSLKVTAADVSEKFLTIVEKKYAKKGRLNILKINGQDLSNIENNQFDLVATYSVLHHIPDYLSIVKEMVRVVKPGGIIYLDHEPSESYWNKSKEYEMFLNALPKIKKTWKRFLKISNYINRIRRLINPRYEPEGDIHVWPDDHVEWNKIEKVFRENGCDVVYKKDYLLYKREYPEILYNEYKNKCTDMCVMIARKSIAKK